MTQMVVGYRLLDEYGVEVQAWGGSWGTSIDPPNPIRLPNGDIVHAPALNTSYSGYMLVEWMMDEPTPPVSVPVSITRRQCALQLLATGNITAQEALDMTKTAAVPFPIALMFDTQVAQGNWTAEQRLLAEIDFAATNYYRSNNLLSLMGQTPEQIDQFFISASNR